MEDHFLSFPFLLSLMLLMFTIFNVIKRLKTTNTTSNLPPGPWKLPIFGSIHHLIGSLPHHRLKNLSKKYGPLMHMQLGETSAVVVSSPEIAKEVLRTHEITFSQRPRLLGVELSTYGCTDIVFAPYGDYWRRLRKICTMELLNAKRVRSFHSIREQEVSNLIRYISTNTGSCVNLTDRILSMTYGIVSRAAFGDKCKDQEAYVLFIKKSLRLSESFSVTNLFPSQRWLHVITGMMRKHMEMHTTSDKVLENIITEATARSGGGDGSLLSVLLNLKDHGDPEFQLTINNIKAVIQDVFVAGSETSSTTLEWAFSEMLKNPRVMKRAQAEVRQVFGSRGYVEEMALEELKFLKAVIKETLRLHPPTPLVPRECGETCEIDGYTIPGGTQVFLNTWAIGRDSKYWSEEDKFYPERFLECPIDYNFNGANFEFIPFGSGKRICPGITFAQPNIELPLAQLLYYFDWELPFGTSHGDFDMTEAFGFTVRRKNDLVVIPISYNPVPVPVDRIKTHG